MSLLATVFHESGHGAEAVLQFGAGAVDFTTIDPPAHEDYVRDHTLSWGIPPSGVGFTALNLPVFPTGDGIDAWMPLLHVDLAGPVAERICQRRGVRRVPTNWREEGDFERLLWAIDALGYEGSAATRFAQTVWEQTVARVQENWKVIEAVAEGLHAKGTMTGAEIARVVDSVRACGSTTKGRS